VRVADMSITSLPSPRIGCVGKILVFAETSQREETSGYELSDFKKDHEVTAVDFTDWLANTPAGTATRASN